MMQSRSGRYRPFRLSSIALAIYVFTVIVWSKDPVHHDRSQVIGVILAAIFVLEFLISRQQELLLPAGFLGFFGFLILIMAGAAYWSSDPLRPVTLSTTFFQLLVFAVVTVNILVSLRTIWPVALGLIAGLIHGVMNVLNAYGFGNTEQGFTRVGSTLYNANSYGLALFVGCMVVLYLLGGVKSRLRSLLLIALATLFVHQIVFFSGSRKGILGIFVFCFCYFVAYAILPRFSLKRLLLLLIGLVLLMSIGAWFIEQSPFFYRLQPEVLQRVFSEEGDRGDMIRFGLDLWLQRPILGHGGGTFSGVYGTYAHNNYIEIMADYGLVGLLLFYSLMVFLLRHFAYLFRRGWLSLYTAAWAVSSLCLLLFWDVALVSYYDKTVWLFYSVLVAIGYISQDADVQDERFSPSFQSTVS